MSKILIGILIGVIVAAGAYFFVVPRIIHAPVSETTANVKEPDAEVCIQVIASARNPATGEIREFPTPCDVPEGWEPVTNDVPSLDDYQPQ
jgi:hypothetical protein